MRLVFLVAIVALLTLGCAFVPNGPKAGGMAEAYTMSGPSVEMTAEGAIKCTTTDPANHPCVAQYAGGWELWQPIVETLAVPFEALLKFFGRTLVPAGG